MPGVPLGPPPVLSTEGHRVDDLFRYATLATGSVLLLVLLALAFLLVRYRARAGRRAAYEKGEGRVALAVTALLTLAFFLGVDAVLVRRSRADLFDAHWRWPTSPDTLHVRVLARQWAFSFRYPGADGVWGTADDVVTLGDLRVPAGRPVLLELTSADVIHAFYVPELRVKQDAVPGRVTRAWFQALRPATLEVACSQMCGWAHYLMRADLRVLPGGEFEAWYAAAQDDARRRFDPADAGALWTREFAP